MNEQELIERIYPIYKSDRYDYVTFQSQLLDIEKYHNNYVKMVFERASLRLCEACELKSSYPAIANLLCYIAVETIANILEYFKKTNGQKHTDFLLNTKIEKSINKTDVFVEFFDKFCPVTLKQQVKFEKRISNSELCESSFKDLLRYLYVKNRCWIVHKGLFRDFEYDMVDIFIDAGGKKCAVSVRLGGNDWLIQATITTFANFLKNPMLLKEN